MYIYMGKRKPKLCRMKRLDVSPKNKFFFLLKENKSLYSHLLAQHSTLLKIYTHPFVISHFANKNKHDIMYKYTYNKITHQ